MAGVDILTYSISKKYTDELADQFGSLKGAPCTIKSIVKNDGVNTITFEWKNDKDETRESILIVNDGTPIYTWVSGNSYSVNDLVIYSSSFYRCITANSDIIFDGTKWDEICSPDGNYDIIEDSELLPSIFTQEDRKMYYVIDESAFYLWDGYKWTKQSSGGGGGSNVQSDWEQSDTEAPDYIKNKPSIPQEQIQSDWNQSNSYAKDFIKNKPTIPTNLSDLHDDTTHRLVTDSDKTTWSAKSDFSGSFNDLSDIPESLVIDQNYVHTDNNFDNTSKEKIDNLGTAALKNIPVSGNASTTEVVMGNDSRLSDARPASDVYSWAKSETKPSYTKTDIDLGNVDNTSDATKKTNFTGSIADSNTGFVTGGDIYVALNAKLNTSVKGVANGVAELDSTGKIPSSQLPSYVDDVLEYESRSAFPSVGESGKIYVAGDTSTTYRWGGSDYIEISSSLALGETSSTAYRGDRGKTAYDHSQSTHARTDATAVTSSSTNGNIVINGTETTVYTHPGSGTNPHGTTKSDIGLENVGNFLAVSTAVQTLTDNQKAQARTNIGAEDTKVTQTNTAINDNYRLLLSGSANNATETNTSYKSANFIANPGTGVLATKALKHTVNKSMITGTGITAQDKGSGVSPRYYPAKWIFNTEITVSDGDIFTIKIPVAGHSYGVFVSVNNGANYYPIGCNTNTPLTTQFPVGAIVSIVFKSNGQINEIYSVSGGNSRTNITGGAFYVLDMYDSGGDRNNYSGLVKAWGTSLTAGNIIVANTSGLYMHLKQNAAFDITYPILYLASGVGANNITSDTYDIINFTVTTTQSITLTPYQPVYIKGQLNGTTFTPISASPLTQEKPVTSDEYHYILLGIATSDTTVYLQERHPIYAYQYGAFREYEYCLDTFGIAEETSF